MIPLAMLALGPGATGLCKLSGWLVLMSVLVVLDALTFSTPYLFPEHTLAPLGLVILVILAGLELAETGPGDAAAAPDGVAAVSGVGRL